MRSEMRSIARRSFMSAVAAGGGATIIAPAFTAFAADRITLTICSYGGVYQDSQDKAYFKPYQEANPNIAIAQESPESNAKLKAMVESGNVTWDLAISSPDFGFETDSGWLEPIDYSIIDRSQFTEDHAGAYRLGSDVEATLVAYRKDKLKEPPQGFADFFDLKRFPGRRTIWKYASGGVFEIALLADGVSRTNLYPIDVKRALNKLNTIKDQLIWWDTGAQSVQYMVSGEAVMGVLWNGRAVSAGESAPVELAWADWLTSDAFWVVPKGTRHKQAAMDALKYFTSPEAQDRFTGYLPYGPTNKLALAHVSDKYISSLPTSHATGRIAQNHQWWNDNLHNVDPVFQDWLLS